MNHTLQQAIIDYIFENRTVFGLQNAATNEFKAYIFDAKGEYLFGGAQVGNFIRQAIKLITEDQ